MPEKVKKHLTDIAIAIAIVIATAPALTGDDPYISYLTD